MKSKKVLIVEDNDFNRKLFENLIGQLYNFQSAVNGLEAIDYLTKEHFDLILMDIQMPKMDGISALEKIQHSELTTSPVIAVTAFSEEIDRISFLKMGFSDFITKPIRPKEFFESIASHLNRSKKNSDNLEQASLNATILDKSIIFQLMKYNSPETIKAVIRDFLLDTSSLLKKLEIALEEKNEQDLLENLHTLKGNSGTLGANSIYLIAKETDTFARADNWALVEEGIAKLNCEKSIFETYITKKFISEL
ncbi:MAG: two-component system alkaline phosphatase synthesis response regulator PhoP [Algoriphagus sp.]|jgi:two-component system alkaline phosphatase synthesis response regulator PhoP|tara:strand:- start:58 stop:810 length:753 start_codon:yes stop_codon:yes gene_type:complete